MKRTPCNNARACCDCQHPCRLDESIPCSPDCENLTDDGIVLLAQCIADGCDAVASLLPDFEDMAPETFLVKFGDTYQIPDFESLIS